MGSGGSREGGFWESGINDKGKGDIRGEGNRWDSKIRMEGVGILKKGRGYLVNFVVFLEKESLRKRKFRIC